MGSQLTRISGVVAKASLDTPRRLKPRSTPHGRPLIRHLPPPIRSGLMKRSEHLLAAGASSADIDNIADALASAGTPVTSFRGARYCRIRMTK